MSGVWTSLNVAMQNTHDPQRDDKLYHILDKYITRLKCIQSKLSADNISELDHDLINESIINDQNLNSLDRYVQERTQKAYKLATVTPVTNN